MALSIFFFFPDTCGVPLEEIAAIFGDLDELYHSTERIQSGYTEEKEIAMVEHHEAGAQA